MSPAVNMLENAVVTKKLHHGGNPPLTWMAQNAVVTFDPAKNRKLDKPEPRPSMRSARRPINLRANENGVCHFVLTRTLCAMNDIVPPQLTVQL